MFLPLTGSCLAAGPPRCWVSDLAPARR